MANEFHHYEHLTEDYEVIVDCLAIGHFKNRQERKFHQHHNPLEFTETNVIGVRQPSWRKADVCFRKPIAFNADIKYGEDWELWLE
ncbi:hypothetical protein OH492_20375 [Vibrio chagasii]|nr:hypothetical protein [Vibrio chagasii]